MFVKIIFTHSLDQVMAMEDTAAVDTEAPAIIDVPNIILEGDMAPAMAQIMVPIMAQIMAQIMAPIMAQAMTLVMDLAIAVVNIVNTTTVDSKIKKLLQTENEFRNTYI